MLGRRASSATWYHAPALGPLKILGEEGRASKPMGHVVSAWPPVVRNAALPFRNSAVIRPGYALYSGLVA